MPAKDSLQRKGNSILIDTYNNVHYAKFNNNYNDERTNLNELRMWTWQIKKKVQPGLAGNVAYSRSEVKSTGLLKWFGVASYHGERGVKWFSWKRLCLCGRLVTRKGLKQALCRIWRYLNFKIFSIGFRLWIYECIKLCLRWNTMTIPAIKYNNKKAQQRPITFTCRMCVKW